MASKKKVAMVQPPPEKPASKKTLGAELVIWGDDRPFVVVDEKPTYWLVHFLGDDKPTKIAK